MPDESVLPLRQRISEFLDERLESKISGLKDNDPERTTKEQQHREYFQREGWIANAARRVSRLRLVTHPAKATHPDSQATSLYAPPPDLPRHALVGSHILDEDFIADVAGNAGDLDVFQFLQIEHDGRTLLARALDQESELAQAFSDDSEKGMAWVRSFAGITEPGGAVQADPRAKQLYWLVGEEPTRENDFHLLLPLYSTVLAHRIHTNINNSRFSDDSKAARKAHWEGKYSDCEHQEYPNLAQQRIGGSNAQNVSLFNKRRGGTTYLLASLPPNWYSAEVRPLLHVNSAFRVFGGRRAVRQTVRELERFLQTEPKPNKVTRTYRDALVAALVDELLVFAAEIQQLEPGWSVNPECQLPDEEALWLDPERATSDPDFAQRREAGQWVIEIRERFAGWLNQCLRRKLPVGDAEHDHWKDQLKRETDALEEALHDA